MDEENGFITFFEEEDSGRVARDESDGEDDMAGTLGRGLKDKGGVSLHAPIAASSLSQALFT